MGPIAKRRTADFVLPALAIGGLAASVFNRFSIRTSADTLSDLKTLYASAWCFAHGLNAYSLTNIQTRFIQEGIVQPASWYGHAPVYPPTTLALIAPFCALPIGAALYLITGLSILALIAAIGSLLQQPMGRSGRALGWKALLVSLCASWPLSGFALSCGNPSVTASSLAILAFNCRRSRRVWLPMALSTLAILLKPQVGVWFLVGMFLLPDMRTRAVAKGTAVCVCGVVLILGMVMAAQGTLNMQMTGLLSILHSETSSGASMNIASREVLLTSAQITSLQSLLGFWTPNQLPGVLLTLSLLGTAGFWLIKTTLCAQTDEEAVVTIGAWSSFGLLATYHRAHDAVALLVLLPYLLGRLRSAPVDWKAWAIMACCIAMSWGPSTESVQHEIASNGAQSLLTFLALRQVGVFDVFLMLVLFLTLRDERHSKTALASAASGFIKHFEQPSLIENNNHGTVRIAETAQL